MQDPSDSMPPARAIRSYVIRGGRTTAAQQRALSTCWPRFGVDFVPAVLDLARLFGRRAPCTLEIGFGNGEHLLARACAEPGRDFLGVEVHRPGIGHLLLAVAAADLTNLRVIAHDAVEVLQWQIPPDSLDEVQLLFPDPWPKKRHHKRRLVQPPFVTLLASRLCLGGRVHIATDWAPYAEHMREVLGNCQSLQSAPCAQPVQRASGPTRFQRRGERLGHHIEELLFVRAAHPSHSPKEKLP